MIPRHTSRCYRSQREREQSRNLHHGLSIHNSDPQA
jgi:hypothetical protein